jgi:glucokinase
MRRDLVEGVRHLLHDDRTTPHSGPDHRAPVPCCERASLTIVGIDLGGTKVAAASLRGGELGGAAIEVTDHSGQEALLDQLVSLVKSVRGAKLDAVGLGVPSVVDFETGGVIASVNVPLAGVPLRQLLRERLGVPVFVDNDANVAALAEAHDHKLRMVAKNLVMLTLGTGMGGGLVLGGRVYRGATGGAGELGHTVVAADLSSPLRSTSGFPQPGSLERVAAGSALDRLAADAAAAQPESALGRRRAAGQSVLGDDVVRAARAGDPTAAHVVATWAERVGLGIANAINTFDPDEVVLGGGAARAGELLLEPARRVALSHVVPGLGANTTIRVARHNRAGVLGAALLALHELEPSITPTTDKVTQQLLLPKPVGAEL